jgi:hypothetical protein
MNKYIGRRPQCVKGAQPYGGSSAADVAHLREARVSWNDVGGGGKRGGDRAPQFENVSQLLMFPLCKPAVSHFCRCAAEP